MNQAELRLVEEIAEGSELAFERFFKTFFKSLYAYAFTMLRDELMAEDVVQQVFYKIWEKRELLSIHTSAKAFLYKAVYNECLNHLEHQNQRAKHQDYAQYVNRDRASDDNAAKHMELNELQSRLQVALNELPEQCRTIFYMSRFDELKYREIAERMDLSIKTVEAQMTKALKILRVKLMDFLPLLLWIILK